MKFLIPRMIFTAPRLVNFVAGPVIIKAAAAPILKPLCSHSINNGIVPPPQTYIGTPKVAANSMPNPCCGPNIPVKTWVGTYR